MSLPLCGWCQKNPVKQRRVTYCSLKCYGAALRQQTRKTRPLCLMCKASKVSRLHNRFCSHTCAALHRAADPKFRSVLAAGWEKARTTQRHRYAARVRKFLDDLFAPAFTAHPEWTEAARLEVLRAAALVYHRGYHTGWTVRGARDRQKAAKTGKSAAA